MPANTIPPFAIAEVRPGPGFGLIGFAGCPGRKSHNGLSAGTDRDLAADIDAISRWNAAAVLTILAPSKLKALGVPNLRTEIAARHIVSLAYPYSDEYDDGVVGGGEWWATSTEVLPLLRNGFNVLVHCKDGLEFAAPAAADLLVRLGVDHDNALAMVQAVHEDALADEEQKLRLSYSSCESEPLPHVWLEDFADRALGAMLGLAVGDAIGTTLEFAARDSRPRLEDMTGGGPFRLEPGQWTDDTAMALALMSSLNAEPNLDEADLMRRFVAWHEKGEYSCTGTCFDIGNTVRGALARFKASGNPFAGSSDPRTAGNGSLMRLAPVAIMHWEDRARLRDIAARQSRTTHGAPEAVDACIAFAELLADAIEGYPPTQVLRPRHYPYAGRIAEIMAGSWRGKRRDQIASSGYVADSLEAALWCVGRSTSYSEAVLLAANLGDDADTVAAITGQLAGAIHGASGIPKHWLEKLAWREEINKGGGRLMENWKSVE